VLQCFAVCCSVLQCIAVCCSVLQSTVVCCSVLHCLGTDTGSLGSHSVCVLLSDRGVPVAVCCSVCSVLQCALVCCSVLQCVAVCCSVLQYVAVRCSEHQFSGIPLGVCFAERYRNSCCCSVMQCVAVYCCVLKCVAVCCSVLQCVVLCCGRVAVLHYIYGARALYIEQGSFRTNSPIIQISQKVLVGKGSVIV